VFLFWKVVEEESNTVVEITTSTFLPPYVVVTETAEGNCYPEGENISSLVSTWKT
jgi:hypothetical protein